ncbi:MAG TPA: thioredoxin family protein, partial [Thermoanaerobaculia bacterium]|nr:thioredoxin family protein [Thermoanaerobaculia bacterium]
MNVHARLAPLSLFLTLAASTLLPSSLLADDLNWQTDWDAAFSQARAEQKPVFINFFAEWCGPCRAMRRTTMRDPRVVQQLDRFVLLKVDLTKRGSGEKYGVRSFPWYSIRDPWEREVLAFLGYQEARYFAPQLAGVADATAEIVKAGVLLQEGAAVEAYRAHATIAQRAGAEAHARIAYRKA